MQEGFDRYQLGTSPVATGTHLKTGLGVQSGGFESVCRLFAPLELGWEFTVKQRYQVANLERNIRSAIRKTIQKAQELARKRY
uniref:Uncharacterized protein n=1 Tax=Helianthus annuus TaxID=4232 RepID=A0A251VPJ0_HELAN